MNGTSTAIFEARERWLPFAQQLALNNDWDIGNDIERLVDEALPYLSTAITSVDAQRILTNCYHDAPLIQLLLRTSPRDDAVWEQIITPCAKVFQNKGIEQEDLNLWVAQIEGELRELLADYTYQIPFSTVLEMLIGKTGRALVTD